MKFTWKAIWPRPWISLTLVLLWLALVATLSIAHILLALLLAWALPWVTLRFGSDQHRRIRLRPAIKLLGHFALDMVLGNLTVAHQVITGPRRLKSGFVCVPLSCTDTTVISVLMNMICLTPGTVSAWLDTDQGHLWVHGLHISDDEQLVQTIQERYEKPLMEIFKCSVEL
ncbi:MAG: Na+/H+ antiporter subunit E [Rhodoferax sp.]